jgi:hypothetical protein
LTVEGRFDIELELLCLSLNFDWVKFYLVEMIDFVIVVKVKLKEMFLVKLDLFLLLLKSLVLEMNTLT